MAKFTFVLLLAALGVVGCGDVNSESLNEESIKVSGYTENDAGGVRERRYAHIYEYDSGFILEHGVLYYNGNQFDYGCSNTGGSYCCGSLC
jgi:hypothetical protein